MNRLLRLCLASAVMLGAACGGNNDENNNNGTNNGTTTTSNNGTSSSNNGTTDPNNGTTDPNNNTSVGKECTSTGEACDPTQEVNDGFACIDDGDGGVCRNSCDPNGDGSECQAGSLCGALSDAGPYFCVPSDCNGWLDDSSCGAGEQCIAFINDTDLCTSVGALAEGDACESTDADPFPCGPGLFCAFGECSALCGSNSDCDAAAGERCINDTLDNGVGICAVGCDSYSFGQCPADQGCFPVTEADGICDEVGTVAPYQACNDTDTCGEGTACITFQGADAASGTEEIARCLPFCNPVPDTQTERNATCPSAADTGGTLDGFCLDLGETPSPNSGFCIEDCATTDNFGADACTITTDVCTPLSGGFNGCFPGGPNAAGEACDPDDLNDGCDGVTFCQTFGDGSGVCKEYCQPDAQTNNLLGCSGADACADRGDNLGLCQTPCTPDAGFADTTSCPDFLQTCAPADRGEPTYCAASGTKAAGAACAAFAGECQAGDTCINDWAIDQGSDDPFGDGTCSAQCDPFGDNSECGAGQVCAFNFLTLNRAVGHCITPEEDLGPLENCAAGTRVCGQASVCLDLGGGNQCVQFCDLDDSTTCAGTCNQLFNSTEIRVGFCQ